jgi:hypothetical protein
MSALQELNANLKDQANLEQRRTAVLNRWQQFKESTNQRRNQLESALRYQQFVRDANEIEDWIADKLKVATDDAHADLTNLAVILLFFSRSYFIFFSVSTP